MRTEDIKEQNINYYYCEDYIWLLRRAFYIPGILVVSMAVVSWWIRKLFLTQLYFQQAAEQELGVIDVMYWVNERVADNLVDPVTIWIGVTVPVIWISMWWAYRWIKSYDLYKKGKWFKFIPIFFYTGEFILMAVHYHFVELNLLTIIIVVIKLFLSIWFAWIFYPLETRPKASEKIDISLIFNFVEKIIIEHL